MNLNFKILFSPRSKIWHIFTVSEYFYLIKVLYMHNKLLKIYILTYAHCYQKAPDNTLCLCWTNRNVHSYKGSLVPKLWYMTLHSYTKLNNSGVDTWSLDYSFQGFTFEIERSKLNVHDEVDTVDGIAWKGRLMYA